MNYAARERLGGIAVLPGATTVTWEPQQDFAYNGAVVVDVAYAATPLAQAESIEREKRPAKTAR